MTRVLIIAGAIVALFLTMTTAAAEPVDGTIDGHVTNGTAGAGSPTGDEVTLMKFGTADHAQKDQQTTTIGDDGAYSFSGLDRSPDLVYVVVVDHEGVGYPSSGPVDLQQDGGGHADIQVFDATSSDSNISFDRLNLVLANTDPGLMQLYEMGVVVNTADRTFVPENPQTGALAHGLRFALPHGALGPKVQAGFSDEDLAPAPGGVQITSPIVPGQHQFALSFRLPYSGTSADLGLQIPYATTTFNLYLPDGGPRLTSDRLNANGRATLGSRTFSLATAENVSDSTSIAARLDGLPAAGAELTTTQVALAALGALLIGAGLGALALSLRARRRNRPRAMARFERERLRLIDRVADLDERFEAGQIATTAYQSARDEGKRRLVELTRSR